MSEALELMKEAAVLLRECETTEDKVRAHTVLLTALAALWLEHDDRLLQVEAKAHTHE